MSVKDNFLDKQYKPRGYYSNREEMIDFVPLDARNILDIGCGEGDFGGLIKEKKKAEVWGVELSSTAAEKAAARLDRVIIGNIETDNLTLPNNYFDCVVFNDVLEHFQYPWIVLIKVRDHLKLGGFIVASIPNVRYYKNIIKLMVKKEWEYEKWGVLDKTHLRFFTQKSINRMFNRCDYKVIELVGLVYEELPWQFGLLNLFLLKSLDDMRYLQFACVARKQ